MSFTQTIDKHLNALRDNTQSKWVGSKYESIKKAPTTVKGDFGEDLVVDLFKLIDRKAERVNKGKGDFDVIEAITSTKYEIKLATEDVNGNFQFNGIKKEIEYDFVICIGVSPNDLWFNVFPKSKCNQLTVSMVKDGDETYKLTASKSANSRWHVKPLNNEITFAMELEKYE